MQMHQIRYFLALCEERNFTRAARRSGVSQPSLTNGIIALERELGGALFQRKPAIALTVLGYAMQPYLSRIAENADHARQAAQALAERRAHPQRTLVGLELEGNEPSAHGECVHVGRQQVGVVTSGTRSPVLKKNIALCRMNVQYAEPGTEVEVGKLDGHRKRIPAAVVRFPFYDPDKTRPRS